MHIHVHVHMCMHMCINVHVTCACACHMHMCMCMSTLHVLSHRSTLRIPVHAPRTPHASQPTHSSCPQLCAPAISSSYKLQLKAPAAEWHGTLTAVVMQRGGGGRYLSFNVWSLYKALSVPHVQPVRDGAHPHPSPIAL